MSFFPAVVQQSGPFGPVLVLLGAVVLWLAAMGGWASLKRDSVSEDLLRDQANAVLFWGAASAVLGFLGQCQSTYLALSAIRAAPEVNPGIIAQGFVISFFPSLIGMGILAFAGAAWVCLRLLPRPALALPIFLLAFTTLGCDDGVGQQKPTSLSHGVWSLDTGANVFLWDFSEGEGSGITCRVHDILGGLLYMETPCSSVSLEGSSLALEMPTGVRYEGQVELENNTIAGSLLYQDGSRREAPLVWAPLSAFPTVEGRPGSHPYVYSPPEELGDGLNASMADLAGIDPEALQKTVQAIIQGEAGVLKSLLVLRGGSLVLEEYFHDYGPDDPTAILSCTKSISSLLTGLAIQEGHIPGVDAPLLGFFPEIRNQAGEGWERLTLKHLLTMSLALDWSTEEAQGLHGTGPQAFRQILSRNVVGRPGEDWEYVNMNVNLLAGVIHAATGEYPEPFAKRALFEPLGITDWNWDYSKQDSYNLMDGSLRLRPRDMAKIGVMVSKGGVWQGERILAEKWIEDSLSPHLDTGSGTEEYGYLWWRMKLPGPQGAPLQAAFANGWGSQFIILFPELDLVVVTTGGNQENGKHLAVGEVMVKYLLPGVRPGAR